MPSFSRWQEKQQPRTSPRHGCGRRSHATRSSRPAAPAQTRGRSKKEAPSRGGRATDFGIPESSPSPHASRSKRAPDSSVNDDSGGYAVSLWPLDPPIVHRGGILSRRKPATIKSCCGAWAQVKGWSQDGPGTGTAVPEEYVGLSKAPRVVWPRSSPPALRSECEFLNAV